MMSFLCFIHLVARGIIKKEKQNKTEKHSSCSCRQVIRTFLMSLLAYIYFFRYSFLSSPSLVSPSFLSSLLSSFSRHSLLGCRFMTFTQSHFLSSKSPDNGLCLEHHYSFDAPWRRSQLVHRACQGELYAVPSYHRSDTLVTSPCGAQPVPLSLPHHTKLDKADQSQAPWVSWVKYIRDIETGLFWITQQPGVPSPALHLCCICVMHSQKVFH